MISASVNARRAHHEQYTLAAPKFILYSQLQGTTTGSRQKSTVIETALPTKDQYGELVMSGWGMIATWATTINYVVTGSTSKSCTWQTSPSPPYADSRSVALLKFSDAALKSGHSESYYTATSATTLGNLPSAYLPF